MSTYIIPFSIYTQTSHPKLFKICSYEIFFKGLKNEFETAVVNEPPVFEPLSICCIYIWRITIASCLFYQKKILRKSRNQEARQTAHTQFWKYGSALFTHTLSVHYLQSLRNKNIENKRNWTVKPIEKKERKKKKTFYATKRSVLYCLTS